jgi:tetratricopeptide (TPR) repeat protein
MEEVLELLAKRVLWFFLVLALFLVRIPRLLAAGANNLLAVSLVDCLEYQLDESKVFNGIDSLAHPAWQNGALAPKVLPESWVNPYLQGVWWICAGELPKAQQAFTDGLDADFRPGLSSLWLGDLFAFQDDLPRATHYWSKSGASGVFLARAQAFLSAEDIRNTNLYLSVLLDLSDRLEARQVRELASLYQDLGDGFFAEGVYSSAALAYSTALRLTPVKHYVRVRLAKIYRDRLERPVEAIEELERVIELGDEKWQAIAYGELGYTYFLMGQTEQAVSILQRSIDMGQGISKPHFYLGKILQQQGDLSLACAEYQIALELDPDARQVENLYNRYCVSTP